LKPGKPLTVAQEILLAGNELASGGKGEFSEWDLTVTVWKRNKNRFGCRGYEEQYPDHKRVMQEMKVNIIERGWMEKTRPNYYRLTPLGLVEAEDLSSRAEGSRPSARSPQLVYNAVERYVFHRVFQEHLRNREEPRTWLGASAFLGLNQYSATVLDDRIRTVKEAVARALEWLEEEGQDSLRSGPVGGKRAITRIDLQKLSDFLDILQDRFKVQMDAIRRKTQDKETTGRAG
jgi:hypothetical protein